MIRRIKFCGIHFITLTMIIDILLCKSHAMNNILNCFSDDPLYDKYNQITPFLALHWSVSDNLLFGSLRYEGIGWLSLGFSMDGSMVGSSAIIGQPDLALEEKSSSVSKFNLHSKLIHGVIPMEQDEQTLINATVCQDTNFTILTFIKKLNEANGEIPISSSGKNIFLWAIGRSNSMGHHKAGGSFDIDLSICNNDELAKERILATAGGSSGYNKKAMLAHGLVGAIAWSLFAPFSIATAWFRRLIPFSWIYLHVFGNLSCFILTLAGFIIAVIETSNNSQVSHFSKTHHLTGLVMMILATFQVLLGFARPPSQKVEDEDNKTKVKKDPCSPRAIWQTLHSTTGTTLLALSVYQTFSGLTLFADNFGNQTILPFYWMLIVIYICSSFIIKLSITIVRVK